MATPGKKKSFQRLRAMELLKTGKYTPHEVALRMSTTFSIIRAWALDEGIEIPLARSEIGRRTLREEPFVIREPVGIDDVIDREERRRSGGR